MKAQGKMVVQGQETEWGEEFDQRVGEGNLRPAVAAPPSEHKIGKKRDVIIDFNPCLALGTRGGWSEEAHPKGQTVDDDVEKTSPGQAENRDQDYLFHGIVGTLTFPVWGS